MPRGPWCPEHKCHPNECFEIHYPESTRKKPVDYAAYAREKILEQNRRIREQQAKPNPDIISMREKYEERRRRRGA